MLDDTKTPAARYLPLRYPFSQREDGIYLNKTTKRFRLKLSVRPFTLRIEHN